MTIGTAIQPRPSSVSSIIGISQHKLKHLESIQLVREQRANGKQELAFNARPFILCGIPLRRPPKTQLSHTRRNGKFFLDITGYPRFGCFLAIQMSTYS